GGAQQTYAGPFTISTTGSHTVLYWSKDVANNVEAQHSITVNVDIGSPLTTASVSGGSSNGWYEASAQVTLTASDGASGVASTYYTIDGGATQTYVSPFGVATGGTHAISFWSVDAVGNSEHQQSLTLQVDVSPPSTQISTTGTSGNNGWYRSAVQVSLVASDNSQAGVANSYFSVDGGAPQNYAGAFTIGTEGIHQVNYWSVDRLGNTEGQQAATVKIDWHGSTVQNSVSGTPAGNNFF